ncbi:apolipoprotein N-acyltransferase [Desulfoluna spongiiphila]|uniref:apolipoprotein N-acyltransferase n=1 Tax=Desulfoluna spongiiphila TaxID=419481 RepID=UPI00125B8B50|nr:apolipoprotein N-acyltransferase [Desulfoluna spongiiphila]VVS93876.1 apolipoprotein n-acyltransferase [Desulfoluna spongiiphila]
MGWVKRSGPALLSGALLGIATTFMFSWLAWVSLVPYLLVAENTKRPVAQAGWAGLAYGLVMESWVAGAVARYTDNQWGVALFCHGVAVAIMAVNVAVLLLPFAWVRKRSVAVQLLVWPLAATLAEMGMYHLLEGFPWFQYTVGFSQAANLYVSQLAALGDLFLLTFTVLVLNLVCAEGVKRRSGAWFVFLLLLLACLHGGGALEVYRVEGLRTGGFRVALANDNSTAGLRWTRERVDEYADRLLGLAASIQGKGQALTIWNEGVVPWAYRPGDDLTRAILAAARTSSDALHLIGMTSAVGGHTYNSAYLFTGEGKVAGRYDKQNLLKGIEISSIGLKLPFFEASPFEEPAGAHRGLLLAGGARIGVLICNESSTNRVAASFADAPYDCLVVLANNNWFTGTPLIRHHFYFNRIRAIQNRKDLVVNNNLGMSGHISASGVIVSGRKAGTPYVVYCDVKKIGARPDGFSCPQRTEEEKAL